MRRGPHVDMAVGIHEMKLHGRKIRVLAVLFGGIVRREKTRTDHNPMQHAKDDQPFRERAPRVHRALLSVRIRGSAK